MVCVATPIAFSTRQVKLSASCGWTASIFKFPFARIVYLERVDTSMLFLDHFNEVIFGFASVWHGNVLLYPIEAKTNGDALIILGGTKMLLQIRLLVA